MEVFTKEILLVTKQKGEVYLLIQMAQNMKASGKIIKEKATEYYHGKTEKDMKEIG